jgi:hypothetical protein
VPIDAKYTLTNAQNYNRAYPGKREATFEATIDFLNQAQLEQFRMNLKQYLVAQWLGPYIGTATNPVYKSWIWTLPFRHDGELNPEGGPDKTTVEAKLKGKCEYDPALGASYKLQVISQQPPNYNS